MNLHDLDQSTRRPAPDEFFTPEMLERVRQNFGTFRAQVEIPEGAVINNVRFFAPPRWVPNNPTFEVGEWEREIDAIRRERDVYYYDITATYLLPNRVEGVFLDTET